MRQSIEQAKYKELKELRAHLNKYAGYCKYHIDHIYPKNMGGKDNYENVWIVPAEWNSLTTMDRSVDMILFIHEWIMKYGKVCTVIPEGLIELEKQQNLKQLKAMGLDILIKDK